MPDSPPHDAAVSSADTDRPYLRVQPTDDRLAPDAAVRFARQVHGLGTDTTVEVCLATAGADDGVAYYLGTADGDGDEDVLARLERACRTAFPRGYELERVTWSPADVLGDDPSPDATAAAVLKARADRAADWQTRLTPYADLVDDGTATVRPPLATVVDALADSPVPAVYQALLTPYRDWRADRADRQHAIENYQDTWRDQLVNAVVGEPAPDDMTLPSDDRTRLDALTGRDARHSFVLTARAVAVEADGADRLASVVRSVGGAFTSCGGPHHALEATLSVSTESARDQHSALLRRTTNDPSYGSLRNRLAPGPATSRGAVVDAREAPTFALLDGGRLPDAARRGLDPTPSDRTRGPAPTADRLARYDRGFPVGLPVTADDTATDRPVRIPPGLQPLHAALFGQTGAGKSTILQRAILENHAATDGLDIVVAPKGDDFVTEYLRAHWARFGTLDDVVYFDCSEVVPALPFFDIRDRVAAGVPRTTAVEDTVDHYLEILRGVMGDERFDQAVRAPDVIRYLAKAQFDPVHGSDAFSHRDLHAAARRMAERQSAPAVSDDDLERMFEGLVANRARTFDEIMQGVANRMEKLPADRRLARIFNHVALDHSGTTVLDESVDSTDPNVAGPDDEDPTPHVDLGDLLDEDAVVILDTGGLRNEARRVLTLVVLSNLWSALQRRKQQDSTGAGEVSEPTAADGAGTRFETGTESERPDDPPQAGGDDPLVNLYLEEAATVVDTDLLRDLLREGRSFDVSITLAMQFPGQVRSSAPEVHDEILNEVGTVVSGPVPFDRDLARRFATGETSPNEAETRLRALTRGEWLVALPAPFGDRPPQPFVARSCPEPATTCDPAVTRAIERCRARTRRHAGLELAAPATVSAGTDAGTASSTDDDGSSLPRLDTALPHTRRLPDQVEYDDAAHALRCTSCDSRYASSVDGLERAVGCCGSMDAVDRDDVPVCDIDLKLSPAEVRDSDWSVTQLLFLQAVFNAQQLRYSRLEYDLLADSMLRLQEYVGIDDDALDELIATGLLRDEGTHPHKLYGVTPDGRDVIGEGYRSGTDYGHGEGDLEESSQHVLMVEAARRWLEAEYITDEESPVVKAVPYYDLDENRRLDLAGVDADGDISVTVEAERINNDVAEAVPADFDKMAACEPDEAIWVVLTQASGHDVLQALNDPPEGEPRVAKTYANTTPPQQFRIDEPGLTAVYPVTRVRDQIETDDA